MGKKLAVFLFLLLPAFASAQTSAQIEANKGVLKLAPTAQLPAPTCRLGQLWFDTTTGTVKVCDDGVNWVTIGGGVPSATIENGVTQTSGCVAGGVLRSISNLVDCTAGFTYASGVAGIGTASTTSGALRIFNSGHAFYTEMTVSGTQGANVSYTFPDDDGTNGQVLSTNGSGVLDWIDAAAGSVTTAALKDATYCESATGNDSYACTLTTAPANLAAMEGVVVSFQADVANTGAATIAFNGFAATAIVKIGLTVTTALVTGDIRAGDIVTVRYNGTSFACLSCDGNRPSLAISNTYTAAQIVTSGQTFTLANTSTFNLKYSTVQTPDSATFEISGPANCINMFEVGDAASDFNNGAAGAVASTDPCITLHGATANTTEYNTMAVWGEAGGAVKALTAGAATALVRIPVATNSRASGELVYEIYATDGTDMQVRTSRIRYAMTNKAGTEACTLVASDGAAANAETNDDNASSISAGTLTYSIACTNNAANTMDITFNAVSSLAETTLQATWSVKHLSPGQPARQ